MVERLQFLRGAVEKIIELSHNDSIGQALNRIFHENYEELENKGSEITEVAEVTPEILLEHFFVNTIFQKNFYTYGLCKGMELLEGFWQRIELEPGNPMVDKEMMKTVIMDMAFQHNHHRLR